MRCARVLNGEPGWPQRSCSVLGCVPPCVVPRPGRCVGSRGCPTRRFAFRTADQGSSAVPLPPRLRARRRGLGPCAAERRRVCSLAGGGLDRRPTRHRLAGRLRPVKRGEIWFATTGRGGDRPVLVLTRDPLADRIGAVVVAQLTTTIRGLLSELALDETDGLRQRCVVSFDNLHTPPRSAFRRHPNPILPTSTGLRRELLRRVLRRTAGFRLDRSGRCPRHRMRVLGEH